MLHEPLKTSIVAATRKVLQVFAGLFLRAGFTHKTFSDISKKVFVETAEKKMGLNGKSSTVSRISLLTGLTRKDVRRIMDMPDIDNGELEERHNHAARVIHGWRHDPKFCDPNGRPLELNLEKGDTSFSGLALAYGGDIHVRAILDELVNVGCVELVPDGDKVRLLTSGYVPVNSKPDQVGILGRDVTDLLMTLEHNIEGKSGEKFLQRKVCFDAIPVERVPELRRICRERGRELIHELEKILSQHDADVNPELAGQKLTRLGVGIYYFEEEADQRE